MAESTTWSLSVTTIDRVRRPWVASISLPRSLASSRSRRIGADCEATIEITRDLGLVTMCHLPCTGFRPPEVGVILDQLKAGGVNNVLALRGDPPRDDPDVEAPEDGFQYANELVAFIDASERGIIR